MLDDASRVNAGLPILRREDRDAVVAFVEAHEANPRAPAVLYLAGPRGSGRTQLLMDALRVLVEDGPRREILAGTLRDGEFARVPGFEAIDREAAATTAEDAAKVTLGIAELCGVPRPAVELVGKVIERSAAAYRLANRILESGSGEPAVIPALVREAARSRPVVLVLDDIDGAGAGWCSQLMHQIAPKAAGGLPITVIASLDAAETAPTPAEGLPASLDVAASLLDHKVAKWRWLAPLSEETLRELLPPGSGGLAAELWRTTGGRVGLMESLWQAWARTGALVDGPAGVGFAADADRRGHETVHDLAVERVREALPADDYKQVDRAMRLLTAAALLGERFAADVVAQALGEDADDVVDFLDAHLAAEDATTRLLDELGHDLVLQADGSKRSLCLYRFASQSLWLAFRENGAVPEARRRTARALRAALESLYGDADRIATSVAVLADAADDADALEWRARAERGSHAATLRWQAHLILGADRSSWDAARCRSSAHLLVDVFELVAASLPFAESEAIIRTAIELAEQAPDEFAEGRARADACELVKLLPGREAEAVQHGVRALQLFETLGRRGDWVRAAVPLGAAAQIYAIKALGPGHPEYPECLRMSMELFSVGRREGGPTTAAYALSELARVYLPDRGECERLLRDALKVLPATGPGVAQRGRVLHLLGYAAASHGDFETARGHLLRAIEVLSGASQSLLLMRAQYSLGATDLALGYTGEARDWFIASHAIATAVGSEQYATSDLIGLALAEALRGHAAAAEAALRDVPDSLVARRARALIEAPVEVACAELLLSQNMP